MFCKIHSIFLQALTDTPNIVEYDRQNGESYMKVKNITNIDGFFKVLGECTGNVELVTSNGDMLNLKSRLTQYVSLANVFADENVGEVEIICSNKEDIERLMHFMLNG